MGKMYRSYTMKHTNAIGVQEGCVVEGSDIGGKGVIGIRYAKMASDVNATPTLMITSDSDDVFKCRKVKTPWVIDHIPSGRQIVSTRTRAEAEAIGRKLLNEYGEWLASINPRTGFVDDSHAATMSAMGRLIRGWATEGIKTTDGEPLTAEELLIDALEKAYQALRVGVNNEVCLQSANSSTVQESARIMRLMQHEINALKDAKDGN